MSGPKVIRIVSVEEIIETCRLWLARVDVEIDEWTRVGKRNDVISEGDQNAVRENRTNLARMIDAGQFLPLQKQAPLLIDWLKTDIAARFEKKEAEQIKTNRSFRSLRFTAAAVLKKLKQSSVVVPDDIRQSLTLASDDRFEQFEVIEKAVSQALSLLSSESTNQINQKQQELSRKLADDCQPESLDQWLRGVGRTEQEEDRRLVNAEKLINRIRQADDRILIDSYGDRLAVIRQVEDVSQYSLMLDAINLELSAVLRDANTWVAARHAISVLQNEARVSGDLNSLQTLFSEWARLESGKQIDAAGDLLRQIREALDDAVRQRAADSKRRAVLSGLRQLGYAVNDGMSTLWANRKRILARNESSPGLAVELGGDMESGKCQVRVVAIEGAATRAAANDRNAEEHWCSQLGSLQELFAKNGAEIVIEKATPAGQIPIKTVPDEWKDDRDDDRKLRLRSAK